MEVKVEVSKETWELGQGVAALVADVKAQVADGWQPVGDSVAIATATVKDLVPALAGVEKIKDELQDKAVFAQTAALVGAAVLAAVLK